MEEKARVCQEAAGRQEPWVCSRLSAGQARQQRDEQMAEAGAKAEPHGETFGQMGKRQGGGFLGEQRCFSRRNDPDRETKASTGRMAQVMLPDAVTGQGCHR